MATAAALAAFVLAPSALAAPSASADIELGALGTIGDVWFDVAHGGGSYIVVTGPASSAARIGAYIIPEDGRNVRSGVEIARSEGVRPAVASDGDAFLVAWSQASPGTLTLMGRRLGADGAPIDASPFVIAAGPTSTDPDLAFDGTSYRLVWQLDDGDQGTREVRTLRLSPNGKPIGAPVTLASVRVSASPRIACAQGRCAVVWHDVGNQTWGASLAADGSIESAPALMFPDQPFPQYRHAISTAPSGYRLAWIDGRAPQMHGYTSLLALDGPLALVPATGEKLLQSGPVEHVAVAEGAGVVLATWTEGASSETETLRGATWGADGKTDFVVAAPEASVVAMRGELCAGPRGKFLSVFVRSSTSGPESNQLRARLVTVDVPAVPGGDGGVGVGADGGAGDPGAAGASGAAGSSGCGCRVVPRTSTGSTILAMLVACAALLVRARARQR